MNSSNENSKSSVPYVIPTVNEVKERSDNNKRKNTENDFFQKKVPQLSATNVKVMGMLLPTVQAHSRLPSKTEFPLKHLNLIVLFFRKSLIGVYCHPSSPFPGSTANTTFSAFFTIDSYYHYMFWSLVSSFSTADTISFSLMINVRY